MNATAEGCCEKCNGQMEIPITFIDKYNPEQFDIVKFRKGNDGKDLTYHTCKKKKYNFSVLPHRYLPEENVTGSWGYPSPSSINTTQSNSKSLEQLKAKGKDSHVVCGTNQAESHNRLLLVSENTNEFLFPVKRNGIMGVPITFLDKYSPEQFEIVGFWNTGYAGESIGAKICKAISSGKEISWNGPTVNGKTKYFRILIRRKKINKSGRN